MERPDVQPGSEDVTYRIIKASQEQLILSVQTLLLPSTTTSEFHKLFLKTFIVGHLTGWGLPCWETEVIWGKGGYIATQVYGKS